MSAAIVRRSFGKAEASLTWVGRRSGCQSRSRSRSLGGEIVPLRRQANAWFIWDLVYMIESSFG